MFWNRKNEAFNILINAVGGASNPIEDSEKRGQLDFIKERSKLPIRSLSTENPDAINNYVEHKIKVLSKLDDMFYKVEIPDNIELRATEHPMWSELIKDGVVIAEIFFKASVYDYNTHISFI